jgi:hypothetical protein
MARYSTIHRLMSCRPMDRLDGGGSGKSMTAKLVRKTSGEGVRGGISSNGQKS